MMECSVSGVGAWGPGFTSWDQLQEILLGQSGGLTEQAPGPKPEIIPANERRRAPLLVRLAVEASWQAIQHAEIDPKTLGCVFASGLGDTDITDYMCRTLASDARQLSPTKFHNSVHNAAAGYWTISTGSMQSANSIAGFQHSASLGLLESVSQCVNEQRPVLLTLFDAPVSKVLVPLLVNQYPFALSLVLQPDPESALPRLELDIHRNQAGCRWSSLNNQDNPTLHALYDTNPAARGLAIADLLVGASNDATAASMPLGSHSSLVVKRTT